MPKKITLALICLVLISGCGEQTSKNSNRNISDSLQAGSFLAERLFRLNEAEEPGSLFPPEITDVIAARTSTAVYEGLFRLDAESLTPIPALAKSWSFSEDGSSLKVNLKPGVYFHENPCFGREKTRELVAEDIVYCFTNLASPLKNNHSFHVLENALRGSKEYYEDQQTGKYEKDFEGVVANSKYSLTIYLQKSVRDILFLLSRPECAIYPREALDYYGFELEKMMVGTGPFKLHSWDENGLILEKNNNYHDSSLSPWLTGIHISFVKDKKRELQKFKNGELDMVYSLPHDYVVEVLEDSYQKGGRGYSHFTLQRIPELSTEILGFNLQNPVFANKDFRKALSFSINRKELVDEVLNGQAYSAGNAGFIPPGFNAYDYEKIQGYSYNIDSARLYLDRSGVDISTLPKLTLHTASKGSFNVSVAARIKEQLSDALNIDVGINILEISELIDGVSRGEIDFYRIGWTADYPSPNEFLSIFIDGNTSAKSESGTFPNLGRFSNSKFDEWLNIARASVVDSLTWAAYSNAEQILMRNCPVIVLWYDEGYRLLQPHVKDFPMNSIQYRDFRTVRFENPVTLKEGK